MRYARFVFTYLLVVLVGTLLVQAGASFVEWENYFIFDPALWLKENRVLFILWCLMSFAIAAGVRIDDFLT